MPDRYSCSRCLEPTRPSGASERGARDRCEECLLSSAFRRSSSAQRLVQLSRLPREGRQVTSRSGGRAKSENPSGSKGAAFHFYLLISQPCPSPGLGTRLN